MANSNVRFYKLETLPSFDAAKHTGVFVHVTATLTRTPDGDKTFKYTWGTIIDQEKIAALKITTTETVAQWMENRRLNTVASGLWFGGAAGWELLSNEISGGFAENGALKVGASGRESSIFTANQADDTTVTLGTGLSLTTGESGAGNNYILNVDLRGITGAMHYKGGVTSLPTATADTKQGDVWVVSTAFSGYEVGDMFIARADGASATFDYIQGNITLGTADGLVAKNDGALTANEIVIATVNGIQTSGYTLTSSSSRTLTVANGNPDADTNIYHSATTKDSLTILGQSREKTLKIASSNASIDVRGTNNNEVDIDLVWNTVLA